MTLVRQGHVFRRSNGLLVPANESAKAALRHIPHDDFVAVEIRRDTNPQALRRWHALVGDTWENTRFGSADAFADAVKLQVGFCDPISLPGGRVAFMARSTSPAACDGIVFGKFLDDAERFIADLVAGGDVEAIKREAAERLITR